MPSNLSLRPIMNYYTLTPTYNVPTDEEYVRIAKEALNNPIISPSQPEGLKQRYVPFGLAKSEVPSFESEAQKKTEATSSQDQKQHKKRKTEETPKEKKKSKKSKN